MEDIVVSDVLLGTDQGRITIFDLPDRPGNCSAHLPGRGGRRVSRGHDRAERHGPAGAELSVQRAADGPATGAGSGRKRLSADRSGRAVSRSTRHRQALVLGVGMRTHTGVARRMFGALATAASTSA